MGRDKPIGLRILLKGKSVLLRYYALGDHAVALEYLEENAHLREDGEMGDNTQ